jgi:deoxyribonuclease-4
MKKRFLGAHMSIAGGLFRALERGASIDCDTIQLFTRNASRWAAKELEEQEVEHFKHLRKKTKIHPVFAHCSYLINLAAPQFYRQSIEALILEVRRAEQLGLDFVVLHPGAHLGAGDSDGLKRVVDALDQTIAATEGCRCKIAIENTAGQGSCLGCSFEHLEYIHSHAKQPDRIGYCIDTCHLFAAGFDIRTVEAYERTFHQLLNNVPKNKVLAFHLNDSKKPLNSRLDRHEHIGKGFIGKDAFRFLLTDSRFEKVPKVLETPKDKELTEDVMNLTLLRGLGINHQDSKIKRNDKE